MPAVVDDAALMPDLGAVGFVSPPWVRTWTSADTLLYAVAVGAGPDDLQLATENSVGVRQRAVPSYAALVGSVSDAVRRAVGPAWDPIRLVFAGQHLTWHRELPPEGSAELRSTVTALTDKGTGTLVEVDTHAADAATGESLFVARRQVFLRGVGGWDARPRRADAVDPAHPMFEETAVRYRLPDNQALLYRLTGDRHPLHSDPAFARRAGFARPILHGLCTYGVVTRLLLRERCGGDPGRMAALGLRFRAPVWPGDELELRHREVAPGRVAFRVLRTGDGCPVVDGGELDLSPERS